eukprot:g3681.t1
MIKRISKSAAAKHIAPTGVLRAGINLSNFLLVNRCEEDGTPIGLSPDIASEVARRLSVPVKFYTFKGPGELTDTIKDLDIANLANEKKRAKTIRFAPAYCGIEASFLIRGKKSVRSRPLERIVSKNRSAYTLALEEIISSGKDERYRDAKLVTAESVNEGFEIFMNGDADAFACLKPKLYELSQKHSSEDDPLYVQDGSFTEIRQCVGFNPDLDPSAAAYLDEICVDMLRDGFIENSMRKHNVHQFLCLPSTSSA